ncbi:Pr6Pr family membrane protein [Nocardia sp. CDC159]|uniref:Pr6Pr family membrane protein n=1 Tax=Nocardia pulmonis TaxID=2951408 RepID=A0A9X2E9G0_9NOCA|nr:MULTISPECIES: Pr6Pr family membrane protein [Nocardia]MCM6774256.1 Pr6Pr family membrane protein [Nocardia pulmonis]MCM6787143.1 Pr6Pr family membrane protein [Nocardia sp. CDC159]
MITNAGTPVWGRVARVGFAVLGIVALLWIPVRSVGVSGFSLGNYLSYFTIESNILGVVVLLVGGLCEPQGRRWQVVRGAAALYLLITGVVYAVLLAHIDVMLSDRWINDVLHRILPIVLVADWLLFPARLGVTARLVGGWLIYPALYGVYTLIRGAVVDWYPYPFLDPRGQGYLSLLIGMVVLALVFACLATGVAWLSTLRATPTAVP